MKKLDFIYFDAGGGHRAAATALREVCERQERPFEIRLVNLQELLDSLDVFRKVTGVRLQDLYNLMLKKGWTLGSGPLMRGMQVIIRLFHRGQVKMLADFWRKNPPDAVVSFVPHFNRAMRQSLDRVLPAVPLITIITDIADYPPHFWMERQTSVRRKGKSSTLADYPPHFWMERQQQHLVCGSDKAITQALAMGHTSDHVHRVSGMILNPRFYDVAPLSPEERRTARARLGFDPDQPIGLVLFGGQGSSVMTEIARSLGNRQLIMICGHNDRLRRRLGAMPHKAALFVEGFTREIPRYMQLADYFIGKPGPGSISEAVAMHLPVIVERNLYTLPQERYNAEWVQEQGIGIVLPNFRHIARAVDELLESAAYGRFRAATERLQNRAVFEIPDLLEKLT